MKKRLVFIDGPNINTGFKNAFGGKLDYGLLSKELHRKWEIQNIFLYDVYEPGDKGKEFRLNRWRALGYKVRPKKLRQLPDKTWKGDVDAMMLVQIPDIVRKYRPEEVEIVIMSGDGDFCELLESLGTKGFSTFVMAFSSTVSGDLTNSADGYEALDEMFLKIERREREVAKEETNEIMETLKTEEEKEKEKQRNY